MCEERVEDKRALLLREAFELLDSSCLGFYETMVYSPAFNRGPECISHFRQQLEDAIDGRTQITNKLMAQANDFDSFTRPRAFMEWYIIKAQKWWKKDQDEGERYLRMALEAEKTAELFEHPERLELPF